LQHPRAVSGPSAALIAHASARVEEWRALTASPRAGSTAFDSESDSDDEFAFERRGADGEPLFSKEEDAHIAAYMYFAPLPFAKLGKSFWAGSAWELFADRSYVEDDHVRRRAAQLVAADKAMADNSWRAAERRAVLNLLFLRRFEVDETGRQLVGRDGRLSTVVKYVDPASPMTTRVLEAGPLAAHAKIVSPPATHFCGLRVCFARATVDRSEGAAASTGVEDHDFYEKHVRLKICLGCHRALAGTGPTRLPKEALANDRDPALHYLREHRLDATFADPELTALALAQVPEAELLPPLSPIMRRAGVGGYRTDRALESRAHASKNAIPTSRARLDARLDAGGNSCGLGFQ